MRELSLNILDIAENSLKANATLITMDVLAKDNLLTIKITDNGSGMDSEFLSRVEDPFTTTRTTRKVGMGIPLMKMISEMSGGTFSVQSEKGKGTVVTSTYLIDHVDRPPLGDIAQTLISLIGNLNDCDLIFNFEAFDTQFRLNTQEVKKELDGIPLDEPQILIFLRDMINENIKTNFRGVSL